MGNNQEIGDVSDSYLKEVNINIQTNIFKKIFSKFVKSLKIKRL